MSRLDEIKARCDAATEGPWEAKEGFTSDPMIEVYGQTVFINPDLDGDPIQPEVWADVEFISAAREDVPWLLTLVESLTAERDALAAKVARVEKLAGQWEHLANTAINPDSREWLQACSETLRECLSGWQKMHAAIASSEADTGEQEAGHRCEPYYSRSQCGQCGWQRADRLQKDVEEYDAILTRQSDLLTRTVNALRGNPPPLTSWSHHDIPKLAAEKVAEVARLTAERDAAIERLERVIDQWRKTGRAVISEMNRADNAEAERDALAAAHARESKKVWNVEEVMDDSATLRDLATWERLRAALSDSEADTTDTQPTDQEDQS